MLRPYLNRYGLTCRTVNDSTFVRDTLTMDLFNTAGCLLFAHNGLRSLIAVSVTLCLMPAWYSQVDSTGFRSSSLKTVRVFRTP